MDDHETLFDSGVVWLRRVSCTAGVPLSMRLANDMPSNATRLYASSVRQRVDPTGTADLAPLQEDVVATGDAAPTAEPDAAPSISMMV